MKPKTSRNKILFWILFIVFFWLVVAHLAQTEHILQVLSTGKWYWIVLAVLCQVFFYPFYTKFIEYVFNLLGINLNRKQISRIYFASKFTDVALPVAAIGKIAIFVRNSKRHGLPPLSVGIGTAFVMFFEVAGFLCLSLLTFVILHFTGQSRSYLTIPLLILLAATIIAVLFMVRIAVYKKPLNNFILRVARKVAKAAGQQSITKEDVNAVFQEMGSDLIKGGKKLFRALEQSVYAQLINLLTFTFIFLAFDNKFDFGAILAGYVAGLLFTIVSITPQGVGVAEAIMITTLHSFGIDLSVAAVVTLAFRGLLYWLPVFPGFYFFSHLEFREED